MIRYEIGDVCEASQIIILHGCNNRGVMGSGVAKSIRAKYREAFNIYRSIYEQNEHTLELGKVVWAHISPKRIVGNAITQNGYGYDGKQYVDYDAIRRSIQLTNDKCKRRKLNEFAMPRIGAGLGGGDWGRISEIIMEETPDCTAVVYDLPC
jgi:O-acetyl-ADP-ribose deacetylase (regulator of RNase III)